MIRFFLNIALMLSLGCTHKAHKIRNPPTVLSQIRATIIVDAGHGGEDPGAVSMSGLKEKDLSLDIALRIKRLVNLVMPHVNVVMTRTSDKSLSLEERIAIANATQGDAFISIHINSSDNKEAKGYGIYTLDVASDYHAAQLAARENQGVSYILADLKAHDHRSESDDIARFISRGLASQIHKKVTHTEVSNRGHNQAVFKVLFVSMPAVLAELFFISNPDEERLLKTQALRESCARGIVAGIGKYLDQRIVRTHHGTKRS